MRIGLLIIGNLLKLSHSSTIHYQYYTMTLTLITDMILNTKPTTCQPGHDIHLSVEGSVWLVALVHLALNVQCVTIFHVLSFSEIPTRSCRHGAKYHIQEPSAGKVNIHCEEILVQEHDSSESWQQKYRGITTTFDLFCFLLLRFTNLILHLCVAAISHLCSAHGTITMAHLHLLLCPLHFPH